MDLRYVIPANYADAWKGNKGAIKGLKHRAWFLKSSTNVHGVQR